MKILIFFVISCGLFSFESQDIKSNVLQICYVKQEKSMNFDKKNIFLSNIYPGNLINEIAVSKGRERFEYLKCLKDKSTNKELIQEVFIAYKNFRNLEIETLDVFSRYILKYDKYNKFTPIEVNQLNLLLEKKKELYFLLSIKTEKFLLKNEAVTVNEFISIYEAILRLHFELITSLPVEIRDDVVETINNI